MSDQSYFGVMLDMSRNAVMKPEEIMKFADIIASFGYNMIQLYTEDTYEIEGEPYFGYLRGRYTPAELCAIRNHCEKLGVELVPCIQTLAHLGTIFRWGDYGRINDFADILLAEEERTYELIDRMFATARNCFTSHLINIGMDEAHMIGLGKYLDKHGYTNRFEILKRHLERVMEIARKYDFQPMMWSDMFFRLANHGEYFVKEDAPELEGVSELIPTDVSLIYWDYYGTKEGSYQNMLKRHLALGRNVWFAGGAWSWSGFAPGNLHTLETMIPAMNACRENGVKNIFLTLWGDNGKECSYFSLLPSLYAVRQYYLGVTDPRVIADGFHQLTGESYDHLSSLDLPNLIGGNTDTYRGTCKYVLYSDPFLGFFDSTVRANVGKEYKAHAEVLASYANGSSYDYIFKTLSALCHILELKYDLGVRTRKAYVEKNRKELERLVEDYRETERRLENFHRVFRDLWYRENKPHGFDVQDQRLGGLLLRLRSCRERLQDYLNGVISDIPELDEKILDYFGNGENYRTELPWFNNWKSTVTPNNI